MSLVHLPNATKGTSPEQSTVHNMLVENGQIIETIAEYQRMGRIEDAMKYQELLHRNILYLAKFAEPELASQLQQETNGVSNSSNGIPSQFPPSSASFFQQRPANSNGLPQQQLYSSTSPHLQQQHQQQGPAPTNSSYAPPPPMMAHPQQQLNGIGGASQQQHCVLPMAAHQYQQAPPQTVDPATILHPPGHYGQINSQSLYPNTSQSTSSSGAAPQQQPGIYIQR